MFIENYVILDVKAKIGGAFGSMYLTCANFINTPKNQGGTL